MEKQKRDILLALIFFIATISTPIITISSGPNENSIVPLFNLDYPQFIVITYILWPHLLSLLFVVLFPLIIVPLFLMLKKRVWYNFKDAYVDLGELKFSLKTFIKRGIYTSLLVVGIILTISNLINLTLLLAPSRLETTRYSDNLLFDPEVINALAFLILPFVVGLWSVGWTMEDIGLMHYRIPKEDKQLLFEIEPVHLKYNGILKGYAGISSVLFLITAVTIYFSIWPPHFIQVILTIVMIMFFTVPAYLFYMFIAQKLFRKIFRKGLKQIERLKEESIVLK